MSEAPDFYVRCQCCRKWSTTYPRHTEVWLVCDCPPPLRLEVVERPPPALASVVAVLPEPPSGVTEQPDHVGEHEQV